MIKLFYFSGTGNTKIIAELVKETFERQGHICILFNIEDLIETPVLKDDDLIGLMYPIYAGGTPRLFKTFMTTLKTKNHKAFIIKTAGDFISFNHHASYQLIKKAKERGLDIFYDRLIVMSSNVVLVYPEPLTKDLYYIAKEKVHQSVIDITQGMTRHYKSRTFSRKMVQLAEVLEDKLGAKFFGLCLHANQSCNGCGICLRNCPMNNIKINFLRPSFKTKCLFCMRCLYNCPQKAINAGPLNFFIIKKGFSPNDVIKKPLPPFEFNKDTKVYFRHFKQYFDDKDL